MPVCKVYRYGRKGYELFRVGLAPRFVKRWEEANAQREEPLSRAEEAGLFGKISGAFSRIFQRRRERRELEEQRLFWEQQFGQVTEQVVLSLEECGGSEGETYFSGDERLLPLLTPEASSVAADIWRKRWGIALFDSYMELQWVEHLMEKATLPYFLILGYVREIPELLYRHAVRMKGLKWILPEWAYSESLQEFLEDFYEEYGIAAAVQVLKEGEGCGQTRLSCREPSNILDFWEDEKISTANIAKGSVWLDMTSSEEKYRRVEGRNTGIFYFSLKKEWKHPVNLDTTCKNGYNTES